MKNLAGESYACEAMEEELKEAGIPVVPGNNNDPEVRASVHGEIGSFKFYRHWYYWGVSGLVPLDVAQELYADPLGKKRCSGSRPLWLSAARRMGISHL